MNSFCGGLLFCCIIVWFVVCLHGIPKKQWLWCQGKFNLKPRQLFWTAFQCYLFYFLKIRVMEYRIIDPDSWETQLSKINHRRLYVIRREFSNLHRIKLNMHFRVLVWIWGGIFFLAAVRKKIVDKKCMHVKHDPFLLSNINLHVQRGGVPNTGLKRPI